MDNQVSPASKLIALLEKPRRRYIYVAEMLLLVALGAAVCFVEPAQLLDQVRGS